MPLNIGDSQQNLREGVRKEANCSETIWCEVIWKKKQTLAPASNCQKDLRAHTSANPIVGLQNIWQWSESAGLFHSLKKKNPCDNIKTVIPKEKQEIPETNKKLRKCKLMLKS